MNISIKEQNTISQLEFVTLMALLMSLAALSIDAMLPALSIMGVDLGTTNSNNNQLIITSLFIGLTVGQTFYGPLSDTLGRKPVVKIGVIIFIFGSILSIFSKSFELMLFSRFIQGIGISSTRVTTLAIIRDQYSGNKMAKIMSLISMVFIIVPTLAPAVGQVIMNWFNWRSIFIFFIILGIISFIWFEMRQRETLALQNRKPFKLHYFISATKTVFSNPISIGYTVTSGFIFGGFLGYLFSSQQIFQEVYGVADKFPLYFGLLAITIGCSSFINSQIVERLGMTKLTTIAMTAITTISLVFFLYIYFYNQNPSLIIFMVYLCSTFSCVGILFGNLNSLALEPVGDIAGMATSIISTVQGILSIGIGTIIGRSFNGNVFPLVIGFLIMGAIALVVIYIIHFLTRTQRE